ncbi:MAG: hypothetical protein KDJ52_29600, partial [Anaerolineae bacterium]|nr:hypothetical protein [Anaerolineae bacterium]
VAGQRRISKKVTGFTLNILYRLVIFPYLLSSVRTWKIDRINRIYKMKKVKIFSILPKVLSNYRTQVNYHLCDAVVNVIAFAFLHTPLIRNLIPSVEIKRGENLCMVVGGTIYAMMRSVIVRS